MQPASNGSTAFGQKDDYRRGERYGGRRDSSSESAGGYRSDDARRSPPPYGRADTRDKPRSAFRRDDRQAGRNAKKPGRQLRFTESTKGGGYISDDKPKSFKDTAKASDSGKSTGRQETGYMINSETRRRYRRYSFIFPSHTQLFKHIRDITDGIKIYRPAAPKEKLNPAIIRSDSSQKPARVIKVNF